MELLTKLKQRIANSRGATAVEHALLMSLIAVVALGAVKHLGLSASNSIKVAACAVGGGSAGTHESDCGEANEPP